MKSPITFAISLTVAVFACSSALADRHPNADERKQIEEVLTAAGYSSWGEVELDNDKVWEVDDARHSDGYRYDLELDVKTLKIIDKVRD
ncbi:PepSY domain-containing protein [Falsochrobactrum sp. TDYN1]|uniref:PepSY domain-containing protein n=1 Tax=Falsochrobactrum tianjinense TaxID=2706015 RepID=A0A949UU14_9HYPH|nr:PepSY domain-containing protein [Falsochrobactrum sp. TDYN1]MBV2143322.1 PepSY domain-containing protein [Falsochrobactrum sp. TDYN1]